MNFGNALPYKLERGGERRRKHRCCERRLYHVADQKLIYARPIRRLSDQSFEGSAGISERPHGTLLEADTGQRAARALCGIGRKQVVKRCRPFRLLYFFNRLRQAALKNVTIELWPIHHASRNVADGFQSA